ncbi:MAG TPA: Uma2 family endonuclease [Isosphaeraceae bacterium]|nr:Uma2 family endonuclease [Isosphaeraceae bacterium]
MATIGPRTREIPLSEYPTGDGKPMAETPIHGDNMFAIIDVLRSRYAHDPSVYIAGNMLMYYVPNDKRRHVSPDVFLVKDIPHKYRGAYFVWIEGKAPNIVFEISSRSTSKEDLNKKFRLYQDTLQVPEYFLFDPMEEYLSPSLQGFLLRDGAYVPIEPVEGRLPSAELGLHMERDGAFLRLYDPATGQRLLTSREERDVAQAARRQAEAQAQAAQQQAEAAKQQAEAAQQQAEAAKQRSEIDRLHLAEVLRQSETARLAVETEREALRGELEELRRRSKGGS